MTKGKGRKKRKGSAEKEGKKKPLLLVESPTKARTLAQYLHGRFVVLASKGHIKDLPPKELGVDLETFEPKYELIRGKGKTLAFIKKVAKESEYILIGSDPDREGEAIAHHLAEELKRLKKPIKRVLFYEITPEAVREAVENPTEIDERKVEAQKARRVLDRLVGYLISPILWKKVKGWGLSAGRVQTAALRLIVEREREIRAFKPQPFWHIYAHMEAGFVARTVKEFKDEGKAKETYERLKGRSFTVVKYVRKEEKKSPPPPLKTSTLQQVANSVLGFSAEKTMQLAQKLFEGVEIDGKRVGLITYHRTDSTRLSRKGINLLRKYVKENFPEEYLPARGRPYGRDRGNVQGAHEAIRPTYPDITPESLKGKIDEDLVKLYDIIWRRAVASQMAPLRYERREVILEADGVKFKAEGRKITFDGWSRVWPYNLKEGEEIPDLKEGDVLKAEKLELVRDETKPPPRYTQASLVETLEKLGIGRPSTYATIISTLFRRKYIYRRGKALAPTERGEQVLDELLKDFPDIFEYDFTAKMEEKLDRIEEGEESYSHLIREFYGNLKPKLEKAKGE